MAGMTEAGGEGCDRGELDGAGGGMGLPMSLSVSGALVSAIGSISMFTLQVGITTCSFTVSKVWGSLVCEGERGV